MDKTLARSAGDQVQPPPPPEFPRGGKSNRGNAGRIVALSILGIAAAIAVVVVIALLGVIALRFGIGSANSDEPRALPPVAGAPEADLVMIVTPIEDAGAVIDQRFVEAGGQPMSDLSVVMPESTTHILEVRTPYDDYSYFSWFESSANAPGQNLNQCSGAFGNNNSFATCGEPVADGAAPTWGVSSGNDNFGISFDGLSPDAEWMVVETESGLTIAARVVDGVTFLEWPATATELTAVSAAPERATALDADFNEVWTQAVS